MTRLDCKADADWLKHTVDAVQTIGFAIVEGVVAPELLGGIRVAMYRAQAAIREELGETRLKAAGEIGVLRLMMKFEPILLELLRIPEVLAVVDATVSETAILHTQNGFILPSVAKHSQAQRVFQNTFHRDFPRFLNGYLASINTFFAIDAFSEDNGATIAVPGSQQKAAMPSADYMKRVGIPVTCPAGSMVVFDSTLWHAAGDNRSGQDRLAVNQQFTRSWIKQQIDYVRALGDQVVVKCDPRTQQLLGYYTRVVTGLDEYYKPEAERLYRKGQG